MNCAAQRFCLLNCIHATKSTLCLQSIQKVLFTIITRRPAIRQLHRYFILIISPDKHVGLVPLLLYNNFCAISIDSSWNRTSCGGKIERTQKSQRVVQSAWSCSSRHDCEAPWKSLSPFEALEIALTATRLCQPCFSFFVNFNAIAAQWSLTLTKCLEIWDVLRHKRLTHCRAQHQHKDNAV